MNTRTDEKFLNDSDLEELDRPDPKIVFPKADDPVNEAFRKAGALLAITALFIVWFLLLVSVALRYIRGSSLDFATELPAYLYPWIITGGVVVAMSLGGHIAVDFVLNRISPQSAQKVQVGVWVFSGLLFTLVAVLSLRLAGPLMEQITPILSWPRLGSFAAFTVMSGCLAVQSFARAWFISRQHGQPSPTDATDEPKGAYGV